MKQALIDKLNGDLSQNKSVPFWSWNNSLSEEVLLKQIDDMYSVGIGGFIMHARLGMCDEYLGEKWFSCIQACLKKARELNMEAWVYDENGWPSGFVGGKLLENVSFRARYLEFKVGAFDGAAFATFITDETEGYKRVEAPVDGVTEYYSVYLRISPSNTDILNPAAVDAFIAETHEKYYARFAESFGRELVGFFTDEPQFYARATPYTPFAEPVFARDGANIKDGLIWLFVQDERGYAFRQKYYGTLNDLYVHNYYKKLYDWCEAHNCKLTGHSAEENSLGDQMYGAAAVTPTYEFEHVPGIDCLCRNAFPVLSSKQVGSAASQLGKKFVLTETFACSGHDTIPKELKNIAEMQYFNGINKTCQHLYPYSVAGQGKIDHPPVFSPQANWFEGFKEFNDYFTRLGGIISDTRENCDIVIISPVREIWMDYLKADPYGSVAHTEGAFRELLAELHAGGVTYQLADEAILKNHGSVENKTLRVGNMEYSTVLVPNMRTLSKTTIDLLREYALNGGKLCVLRNIEYADGVKQNVALESNTSFSDIKANAEIKFSCEGNCFITSRSGDIGDFIFVKNASLDEPAVVRFENVAENYVALDLLTLKTRKISNVLHLEKCGSYILVKDESAESVCPKTVAEDVTANFSVYSVSENYLVIDYGAYSYNGTDYCEQMPMPKLFEQILRADYKGKLFIKHEFNLAEKMPLSLVMEKGRLLSATVNGRDVNFEPSAFDINFVQADISSAVEVGKNTFVYEVDYYQHEGVYYALFAPNVTESLRNCLYYDTHIENVYLKGDFVLSDDFTLSKRRELPELSSQNYKKGYPFFYGKMLIKGVYNYDGVGSRTLALGGRFVMAKVRSGDREEIIALDTQKDVSHLLKKGENLIEIEVRSSLRNLFGPHHYIVPEPLGVAPSWFNMRGSWKDGNAEKYAFDYHSVPFGIDKIEFLHEI